MRLFRRNRTGPANKPAAPATVWPPQPEVVAVEPGTEAAAPAPAAETPARAVQVVTGPPPLRTPEPASAQPVATEPTPEVEPVTEPEPTHSARQTPEPPQATRHWHLAAAEMRVPATSTAPRRASTRESHQGRWHQV